MSKKIDFSGYACWSPEGSHNTIFVDAASPSDAVFLATHQPMRLIRRALRGDSEGEYVTEQDLLDEFLKPDEKMMLLPIVGGSGTGKSHLVRWIRAQMGTDDPSRRVVYVPKHGTSLRKVIELILDQMEGDVVTDLREALDAATSKLDERAAPSAVLNALADCVEYQAPRLTGDAARDALRKSLSQSLPALLRDPFFRDAYFLADKGIIRSFVERALRGHRPGDKEEAFEFTTAGIQEITYLNSADASRAARDAKSELGLKSKAECAAELLTENLGTAIQSVFGLEGAVSLTDVMMQTRAVLAKHGVELVLLIEDFTMLQGIQRELLDAIVEPPDRSGEAPLCGIRVTLAVTAGYWDTLADTVRTRAGFASHLYDLNVPVVDDEAAPHSMVLGLVSRYLNAARLGRQALDDAYTPNAASDWVPNACAACKFRNECHEAFGSVDNLGLYPFNLQAIARTVSAVTDSGYVDPRAILGSVVKYTLEQQHEDLEKGRFPSQQYQKQFTTSARHQRSLPADVVLDLQRHPEPKRREALLTIWGGCPDQLIDLPPGVHKAFRLPEIGVGTEPETPTPRPEPSTPGPRVSTPEVPSSTAATGSDELQLVDAWGQGSAVLDEKQSRLVRRHLADALWSSIDWDAELLKRSSGERERLLSQASFVVEGFAGGREAPAGAWTTSISPDPYTAALVKGIVQYESLGHWSFPGGSAAFSLRANAVDEWRKDFLAHLRGADTLYDPQMQRQAIQDLLVGAVVLGQVGADSNDPLEVLSAALAGTEQFPLESVLKREGALAALARSLREERDTIITALLRDLGARQGGGGVHALDTRHLIEGVDQFLRDPASMLDDQIHAALGSEMKKISDVTSSILEFIGDERDSEVIARSARAAAEAAGEASAFYPGSELQPFISGTREAEHFPMDALTDAIEAVRVASDDATRDPRHLLIWVASRPLEHLSAYRDFLADAAKRLSECSRRAHELGASKQGGSSSSALASALERFARNCEVGP